jgi:hypothetical protein
MSDDLFDKLPAGGGDYDASSIEVLEGLEPVRRRPGMYIGGIDERAIHHLAAEVLDNAMDEAVAGHASRIEVTLEEGNRLTIFDNGRGMPIDEHVEPALTRPGVGSEFFLAMSVGPQGRLAALDNLRSAAATFNLKPADADDLILQIQTCVATSWRDVLGEAGFDDSTLDTLAPSFGQRAARC